LNKALFKDLPLLLYIRSKQKFNLMQKIFASFLLLAVGLSSQAQCLQASYFFNGNANDLSVNAYNAVVHGAVLTTDRFGNANSAYKFDGINDYIDTEHSFDFQERTISLWFKSDSVYTNDYKVIDQDAANLNYGAVAVVCATNGIFANPGGEGRNQIYSSIDTSHWYHIILIRDSLSSKVYLDGNLVYTGTPSAVGSFSDPNPELVIGVDRTENGRFFAGKIDDIMIYNCALDSSQFAILGEKAIVSDKKLVNWDLYPNPSEDQSTFRIENNRGNYTFTLTDQQGRVLRVLHGSGAETLEIERDNLASGIYFFQVEGKKLKPFSGKLVFH